MSEVNYIPSAEQATEISNRIEDLRNDFYDEKIGNGPCVDALADEGRKLLASHKAQAAEIERLKAEVSKWQEGHSTVVSVGEHRLAAQAAKLAECRAVLKQLAPSDELQRVADSAFLVQVVHIRPNLARRIVAAIDETTGDQP
jgi:hypothetical protein